eukprot:446100_1
MACDLGILWAILNFIGGFAITVRDLDFDFGSWFLCWLMRMVIGISIIWISITSQCCDQYMLVWFPFWNQSFFFMGCTFIFFCCSPWNIWDDNGRNDDDWRTFRGILEFITFCTGITYLILGVTEYFGCCGCPKPAYLIQCCGGGGGGSSGDGGGG